MTSRSTPRIFKAYDIRGIYPTQIDGEVARRIGRAFVDYLGAKRIAVGRDVRLSSPEIAAAFIRGRAQPGRRGRGHRGGGHRHAVLRRGQPRPRRRRHHHRLPQPEGMERHQDGAPGRPRPLRRRGHQGDQGGAGGRPLRRRPRRRGPAARSRRPISDDYARHCLSFIDAAAVPPLKAVLDTGNGMGAVGAQAIFPRLPLELVKMYFELDGTFPNHPADPLEEANRREIMARVTAEKARPGHRLGRRRRPLLLHRRHRRSSCPATSSPRCWARPSAGRSPGRRIVYDVRASRAVRDRVEAAGGKALMHRVGHAFIKKRMRDENAVFGGEVSGHFYFRENWFADNGMIPALLVLEMLGREGQRFSELLAPLARALPHLGRDQLEGRRRGRGRSRRIEERYGTAAITQARRRLGRLRRLALQRAPLEHGAAAAPEPRGLLARRRWSAAATRSWPSSGAESCAGLTVRTRSLSCAGRYSSGRSSVGRVRASQARCRGFEPRRPLQVLSGAAPGRTTDPCRRNHGNLREAP